MLNVRVPLLKAGVQVLLEEPKEYHFAGSQFFRDDVVESNGVNVNQAYYANIANGYALVFIFLGPDQKSVEELAKAMETFTLTPPIRKGVTTTIDPAPQRKP